MKNLFKWLCAAMFVVSISVMAAPASHQFSNTITADDVSAAQETWGRGIVQIGQAYERGKDYRALANAMIKQLYAYNYGDGIVLFKPTLASQKTFQPTMLGALSYYVGGNKKQFGKDKGFALKPWKSIFFQNDQIFFHGDVAVAMGHYIFTPYKGKPVRATYTLGYIKDPASGNLKIFLHRSSLPY